MNRSEIFDEMQSILDDLSGIIHLPDDRKESLLGNQTLLLITAIPYLAASAAPRRDALTHMMTYLLSILPGTKEYYLHGETDDVHIMHRLKLISTISSGNEAIANAGVVLIARNMLEDYHRDRQEDMQQGKYNPLVSGKWDYETLAGELEEAFAPYQDLFRPILDPDTYIQSFWED